MKTGRPKDYKNRVMFTTTMEGDLLEKFKDISIRDRKNMNNILQELIEKYVKEHGDGNEQYTLDSPTICTPAMFRDYPIILKYMMSCKDEEEEKHRFKLQEWNGAFKQRWGNYP